MSDSLRQLNLQASESTFTPSADWLADGIEMFDIDNSTLLYTSAIFWLDVEFSSYTTVVGDRLVDLYILAGTQLASPVYGEYDSGSQPNVAPSCVFSASKALAAGTAQLLQSPVIDLPADKLRVVLVNVSGEDIEGTSSETNIYYRLLTDRQAEQA